MIDLLMPQSSASSPVLDKAPRSPSDVDTFKALMRDSSLAQLDSPQAKTPLVVTGVSNGTLAHSLSSVKNIDNLMPARIVLASLNGKSNVVSDQPSDIAQSMEKALKESGVLDELPFPVEPMVNPLRYADISTVAELPKTNVTEFEPNAFTRSLLATIDMGHRSAEVLQGSITSAPKAPGALTPVQINESLRIQNPLAQTDARSALTLAQAPVLANAVDPLQRSEGSSNALVSTETEADIQAAINRTSLLQTTTPSPTPALTALAIPLAAEPMVKNARMTQSGLSGIESITAASGAEGTRMISDSGLALKPSTAPVLTPTSPQFAQDLSKQMIQLHLRGEKNMEIKLNPADLGPLTVNLKVNDAQALVHFTTANAQVRQALEGAFGQLREMMSEQGLNLSGSTVGQGAGQGRGQGQQNDEAPAWLSSADSSEPVIAVRLPTASSHEGMIDIYA